MQRKSFEKTDLRSIIEMKSFTLKGLSDHLSAVPCETMGGSHEFYCDFSRRENHSILRALIQLIWNTHVIALTILKILRFLIAWRFVSRHGINAIGRCDIGIPRSVKSGLVPRGEMNKASRRIDNVLSSVLLSMSEGISLLIYLHNHKPP